MYVAVLIVYCGVNAGMAYSSEQTGVDPLFLSSQNPTPSREMQMLVDALMRSDYFQRLEQLPTLQQLEVAPEQAERYTIVLPSALASHAVSYIIIRKIKTSEYWIIRHGGLRNSLEIFRGVPIDKLRP
jgi:hypothetical protein